MAGGWSPLNIPAARLEQQMARLRPGKNLAPNQWVNEFLSLGETIDGLVRAVEKWFGQVETDAGKLGKRVDAELKRVDAANADLRKQLDGALKLIAAQSSELEAVRRLLASVAADGRAAGAVTDATQGTSLGEVLDVLRAELQKTRAEVAELQRNVIVIDTGKPAGNRNDKPFLNDG